MLMIYDLQNSELYVRSSGKMSDYSSIPNSNQENKDWATVAVSTLCSDILSEVKTVDC